MTKKWQLVGGVAAAVLAIVGAIVTITFDPFGVPDPDNEPEQDWDQFLAWDHAQDVTLTEQTCVLTDDQPVVGAAFSCEYDTLDALILAVDGVPVPTLALFTVSDGAITEIHHGYGQTDFVTAGGPFANWMDQNHPDVEGAGVAEWTSRAEAVEHGQLRARWAREWDTFLEANDRTSPYSPCPPD